LRTSEGQQAARYLRERRLGESTADAFGIGYAPASGQALVAELREAGLDLALAEKAGLVRRNDQGRPYDFFRGRMTIPIRDLKGRTVGFGARRLSDEDAAGPKYVNTPETPWFLKGRLVYALDRALPEVRRQGRIVLVEGYTDVMAAHQEGVGNVVAVLGTATTDEHAALIRKTGARRISLVFDGDEAGRKASYKALHGLLPLEVEIDVVSLSGGIDPCDLLTREGASAFLSALELARGWFDFLVEGLRGHSGAELAREVDRVLELLSRLAKPIHRDALIRDLARAIGLPEAGVREQWAGRRAVRREVRAPVPRPAPVLPADPRPAQAYEALTGALLCDASLVPVARALFDDCPDPELAAILAVLCDLYDREELLIEPARVIGELGEHAARHRVVPLHARAASAESPRALLEGQLRYLRQRQLELERRELERELAEQERIAGEDDGASAAANERANELARALYQNSERLGELRASASTSTTPVRTQARANHG
jgi:DNA primase